MSSQGGRPSRDRCTPRETAADLGLMIGPRPSWDGLLDPAVELYWRNRPVPQQRTSAEATSTIPAA